MQHRLIAWFLAVALLPLLAVTVVIYQQRVRSIKQETFDKLTAIRDLKVDQINGWIRERSWDMEHFAKIAELLGLGAGPAGGARGPETTGAREKQFSLLAEMYKGARDFAGIYLISAASRKVVLASNPAFIGLDQSGQRLLTEPLRTGQPYISDVFFSDILKKPTLAVAAPVRDTRQPERPTTGVLVYLIDLERSVYPLLLDRSGLGETGETLIVNSDNVFLSELRWHNRAPLSLKTQAVPAVRAAKGETGILEGTDYRGEAILGAFTYLPATRWGFVAKMDQRELYAPIRMLFAGMAALFCAAAVIVCLLAILLGRYLSRPVVAMTETAKHIRAGDLAARNPIMTSDELGDLARAFNAMADGLAARVSDERANREFAQLVAAPNEVRGFAEAVVKKLAELTESPLAAFAVRNPATGRFEPIASLGMNPALLASFDAALREGEFGASLATGAVERIRDIPPDTAFTFKTFAGTIVPREIVTIPVTVRGEVRAMISLASIHGYAEEQIGILHQPAMLTLHTAFANVLANEATRSLAEELREKNQDLQAQSEELTAQSEELHQQSDEMRKQNEELQHQTLYVEEASRLKSQFLSNMSHELRTPLNSVMALSHVLMRQAADKLTAEELNYLGIIERNGRRLLTLINDILDLAKIEAGKMDVNPKPFSLKTTVENILESMAPLAAEKGIALTGELPSRFPLLESDEARVHQILQNIIGNAVKFTDQGGVTVSLSSDAEAVWVEVADTGIGIPEADLPYIFNEFMQVDGSASRRHEGTGLGLAISAKATHLLGGSIAVESAPGAGSRFTVTLPLRWRYPKAQRNPPPSVPPHLIVAGPKKEASRLLLVEDNEAAILQVRSVLESDGHLVDVARGGREALDYVRTTIPDGIVLDLMMPGIDGFAVLEEVRGSDSTRRIPVLILTARDLTPDDFKRLSANNVQQLVQKGDIDRDNLLGKVRAMLGIGRDRNPRSPVGHSALPEAAGSDRMATILIVEDNPDNLTTVRAVLKAGGYRIVEARDGEAGIAAAKRERPDLILLDLALPLLDGLAVARRLKSDDATAHIPVVALTARAMKGDREDVLKAGCDDYVAKPIDIDGFTATVNRWLAR